MTLVNESEDRQLYFVAREATEQGTADRGFSQVSAGFDSEFAIGTVLDGDSLCLDDEGPLWIFCLLYTSPSPRDQRGSRMPSSA